MEELKEQIVSKFKKEEFVLANAGREIPVEDGTWDGIDEHIRPFLKSLNDSEKISTLFSCEGHSNGDSAYLFFNVNSDGWDIFWLKIMPALAQKFCISIKEGLLQLPWYVNITDNEYNTGITIYCQLENSIRTWEEKKILFWQVVSETFMENFLLPATKLED